MHELEEGKDQLRALEFACLEKEQVRFRGKREHLTTLPESQCQNLALTVLYVPYSLICAIFAVLYVPYSTADPRVCLPRKGADRAPLSLLYYSQS